MSAPTRPADLHDPALLGPDPAFPPLLPGQGDEPLLPRHHEEPLLPRFNAEEQPGGWPAEVHLPDEKEDDEC
jgi:hypothetical protein